MTKNSCPPCFKEGEFIAINKDNQSMAKDIQEMKASLQKIEVFMEKINIFMLTSPQIFADKKDFETFRETINSKVAYTSGFLSLAFTVIGYIINKYFG